MPAPVFSDNTIFYSFEKGKQGSSSGLIYPYFTKLASVVPDLEYLEKVPAGFLKCQGQVLDADIYPSLARVIGVGSSCIYKRENTPLQDQNDDGTGGQIQLPDLGSKYIVGSSISGVYSNDDTVNPRVQRAGIQTDVSALSDQVEFFYTGEFRIPGRELTVSGNVIAESPPARTEITSLFAGNFLPHGHLSDMNIADRINTNRNGIKNARWETVNFGCGQSGTICDEGVNYGVSFCNIQVNETGSEAGASHFHFGVFPVITSESSQSTMPESIINAGPLNTVVNVRTQEQIKMDLIAPKFILCEYLIKY